MDFKQTIGNFLRALMVVLIAVSFALFIDVFVIDIKPQHNGKDFIKMLSAQSVRDQDVVALKDQHELYMSKGIDTAYDYSRKSVVKDTTPLKFPRTEVESVTAAAQSLSEDEFAPALAVRPSLLEPAFSQETEARVANFGVRVDHDGVVAEDDVSKIEPASGGDVTQKVVPAPVDVKEEDVPVQDEKAEVVAEPVFEPEIKAHHKADGRVRVVVIIDDMGVSPANSTKVENLPAPLTLSYLPYAKNLPERTKRARANGHELMLHIPMQPMNSGMDGGPAVLKVGMEDAKFQEVLLWGLTQFEGYVGVNNHMGSRLTKDTESMKKVMAELAKRDVYFVDSKTIGSSVGASEAAKAGLRFGERDVFLDHEISDSFVASALRQLEATARKKGFAIAIGHPHAPTIRALAKWIPTLEAKGIELVPASQVVMQDGRYIKMVEQTQSETISAQ